MLTGVEERKEKSKKSANEFQLEIGKMEKTLTSVQKELEEKTKKKEKIIQKKKKEAKVKKASDDLDRQLEEKEEAIKEIEKTLSRYLSSAAGGSKRTPLKGGNQTKIGSARTPQDPPSISGTGTDSTISTPGQ